ncbi:hypothetical protein H261_13274 [Paramagnetospirillum caucaseum]|uniref:Uncharacterized protein n=2 Tax=Paramagnetospirillum caucaseum TaxID=1244869 RepID=M2ZQ51_9PROT|nr:hypothetical protein H261_13274 [Paramagnetospirillum caucaseum]
MASRVPPLQWRTLQDIVNHMIATTVMSDGRTMAEVLEHWQNSRDKETALYHRNANNTAEDHELYQTVMEGHDQLLSTAMNKLHRAMIKDAEAGLWFAFGLRHPDTPQEVIPPRYWPFLTLDIEGEIVTGEGMTFRAIRCLRAEDIPLDHPIMEQIRAARHPKAAPCPAAPEVANDAQPVEGESIPQPPVVLYSGTQGRPSSVETLIMPELRRRAGAGCMEPSLARECRYLSEWLRSNHPTAHQIKPVSLENSLRQLHRELKSTPTKH